MQGLFVTGTDTDVGKTYVAANLLRTLVAQQVRVGAYKPACSGAVFPDDDSDPVWEDVEILHAALNRTFPSERICPQRFLAPLAPPVAAALEGMNVSESLLVSGVHAWQGDVDSLLIEGVGGWKCPLTSHQTIADFAAQLRFPVAVVAAVRLGMINHTLLTLESIQQSGLCVAAVILNVTVPETSEETISSNAEQIQNFAPPVPIAVCRFKQLHPIHELDSTIPLDIQALFGDSASTE